MKNAAVWLVVLLLAGTRTWSEPASSVSQWGITWTFDKAYETGTFANGDYWVVGPVSIIDIDPKADGTRHGSMVNPDPLGTTQAYDSRTYPNYMITYKAELNKGIGISASSPLVLQPGKSLVSSISRDPNDRAVLQTAAVLTVLDKVPPAGSFRPPPYGNDKTIRYNVSQLRTGLLPDLNIVAATPNAVTMAARFERIWLELSGYTGSNRRYHPQSNMPDYGRDMAKLLGDGILLTMVNVPNREELIINLVQIGIDWYCLAKNGMNWRDLGGLLQGRKWPIIYAGFMLGDADMMQVQKLAAGFGLTSQFHTDKQTWYVTQYDVGRELAPETISGRPQRITYSQEHVGMPEWGEQHTKQPSRDNSVWGATYRFNVATSMAGHILGALILGMDDEWAWQPLFDYMDRFIDLWNWDRSKTDKLNYFTEAMWRSYRNNLPVIDESGIIDGLKAGEHAVMTGILNNVDPGEGYTLFDAAGKVIRNTQTLSPGIYFMSINGAGKNNPGRIIITR